MTSSSGIAVTFVFAAVLMLCSPANAEPSGNIGEVDFDNSCDASVAVPFNHALALLHHMMYEQATAAFADIEKQDPACALAPWGIAMAAVHPLWAPPSEQELARGSDAIRRAQQLKPGTEREKSYIDAAAAFYRDWSPAKHREKLRDWSAAQAQIYRQYPGDIDAGALYALSLLATAPMDDRSYRQQKQAGALLKQLYRDNSSHPGANHYTIHAHDNPAMAADALAVARGYDKIAPEVPHALHMPTHIFVRLGLWPDTIDWNIRSAAAAQKQPAGNATSLHYFHALDYLMYAYLQQGRDAEAAAVLEQVLGAENPQDTFAAAFGIAAARARYPLERHAWREAAALSPGSHGDFPWQKYPWVQAMVYFSRGIGAARSGDAGAANSAADQLDGLYRRAVDAEEEYWAALVDSQRQAVRAWAIFAGGDEARGIALMRKAAAQEDGLDKHPVTPGPLLPARELLGDMLLAAEQPGEALQAYMNSIELYPSRFNGLYGAALAAQEIGRKTEAEKYYRRLLEMAGAEDSQREALQQARKFLSDQ
ncbi:TPR repeat [Microbulbifer donghaiensis]|uniref:TPR repeat n=1 Tax=Microbulbifer donghaiensis TaxID=494016 RepID=A0A1M5ALV7_9GAMM|nr:hypothetical protein [Microbulbifer donghaiensis]SHF31146.1 TPR repeat [Microbulbifer donghaiensis]